jgi:hypothetical protein
VIISAQHPDVTIPSETLIEGDWRTATNTLVDTLVSREEQLTMTLRGKSSLQGVSRKRFPPKYAAAITSNLLIKTLIIKQVSEDLKKLCEAANWEPP